MGKILLLIILLPLIFSVNVYGEMQQDVINRDAISADNVPSGVDGSVQIKSGAGFGSETNFFFDTTNISLGIGTNDPTIGGVLPSLKILGVAEDASAWMGGATYDNDTADAGTAFFISRARGTQASPSAVSDGDRVGTIVFYAWGSTFFGLSAEIRVLVCGTPSGNKNPGCMDFYVQDGTSQRNPVSLINNRLQFKDTGISKPTCDVNHRFAIWPVAGGTSVADTFEVCTKDSSDVYAWRSAI